MPLRPVTIVSRKSHLLMYGVLRVKASLLYLNPVCMYSMSNTFNTETEDFPDMQA